MRRYWSSKVGPVPVSSDMCPEEQEIIRAGNAGVLSAQKETNKTKPQGKLFVFIATVSANKTMLCVIYNIFSALQAYL